MKPSWPTYVPALCLAAVLGAGASHPARGQAAARDAPPQEIVRYEQLVERFGRGDDRAADEIVVWPREEFDGLETRLPILGQAWNETRLRRAVVLHVVAAHLAGQGRSFDNWSRHTRAALDLVAYAAPPTGPNGRRPDRVALRRDVALAQGYDLLRRWRPSFALDAFKRALQEDPNHADALLAAGMAEELRTTLPALAHDRYVSSEDLVARGFLTAEMLPARGVMRMDQENSLRAARKYFVRALEADAALVEARVRLGRVLDFEGKHDEAERAWRAALAGGAQGEDACLAHLFLGREAERRKAWDEARDHYQEAVRAAPYAQSAHLALSVARSLGGDRAGAREAVLAALQNGVPGTPSAAAPDPWLRYHFEPRPGIAAVLRRLTVEARR